MTNQGVLVRAELNNTTVLGPQGVLIRAELDNTPSAGPQAVLARAEMVAQTGGVQGVLTRAELRIPATASAGPDQSNIEPYTVVTLTGTDSGSPTDPRSWSQVSGTPVTDLTPSGNTATFTAPGAIAAQALVFGYSAASSPLSTMTVNVLPVTESTSRGMALVPIKLMNVKL